MLCLSYECDTVTPSRPTKAEARADCEVVISKPGDEAAPLMRDGEVRNFAPFRCQRCELPMEVHMKRDGGTLLTSLCAAPGADLTPPIQAAATLMGGQDRWETEPDPIPEADVYQAAVHLYSVWGPPVATESEADEDPDLRGLTDRVRLMAIESARALRDLVLKGDGK
jgi:hypothetical protein